METWKEAILCFGEGVVCVGGGLPVRMLSEMEALAAVFTRRYFTCRCGVTAKEADASSQDAETFHV